MSKITMDQLLTDFFEKDDTVSVSAMELQKLIIEKNNLIAELKRDKNVMTGLCSMYKNKADRLEDEASCSSTYKLDLSA